MSLDWIAPLLTLTLMEIVLGIDNIVFIAILVGRLPAGQRVRAWRLGLSLALVSRLLLLFSLSFILRLTQPLFLLTTLGVPASWFGSDSHYFHEVNEVSWRDLILLAGGLFLIAKATFEIHHKLEGSDEKRTVSAVGSFGGILVQIAILDIIFSLDSVITAIGMARALWVMVTAVVLAVGVMLIFASSVNGFVQRHPTVKMLALSFLILIGVMLVVEGTGHHINKGYIYFAMAFSLGVELLNLRVRPTTAPVRLHEPQAPVSDAIAPPPA